MLDKKFVAITHSPREYTWKNGINYNFKGDRDEWIEISTENPWRGFIGMIHPQVSSFYIDKENGWETLGERYISGIKGLTTNLPRHNRRKDDPTIPTHGYPKQKDSELIVLYDHKKHLDEGKGFSIVQLFPNEYEILPGENASEISENYWRVCKNKNLVAQEFAIVVANLNSLDSFFETGLKVFDLPFEIRPRIGEIDRSKIGKKYMQHITGSGQLAFY